MRNHTRLLLAVGVVLAQAFGGAPAAAQRASPQVEPNAGTWKTWVLTSGSQLRLPPPPDAAATGAELEQLKTLGAGRDDEAVDSVKFWDSGAPGYRWDGIERDELARHGVMNASATTTRDISLVDVAMYDAIVATWDSKYAYNRPRPDEADPSLETLVDTPRSPSYPSEHAAVAGAAATVMQYLYPDDADNLARLADEAAQSRVLAGVQYPSDTSAGLDLGRQVGAAVVERARHDGSEVPWSGTLPTDPNLWNLDGYPDGTKPVAPNFGTLKTWVLDSGRQLRPAPPPEPGSPQKTTELAEIRDFNRTFLSNSSAFYWQSTRSVWALVAEREAFEAGLQTNPPRAAQVNALLNIAGFDATVACFDAKYTYWARRPFQLDPTIKPLFQTPAHPAYPSAHGCISGAQSAILARLFPRDATWLTAQGDEAAMSRMWAGIHYRSDIEVGLALGRTVADLVSATAQ